MEEITNLILNTGVAIIVVAYFLWKDATLTKENSDILQQVKSLLQILVKNSKAGGDDHASN